MNTFALSVFASDHIFFQGNAVSLTLPATDGLYGIQANHRNLIGAVIPGKLTFTLPDGTSQVAAVSDGMFKVENNDVLVLVETAERPEEIDINRARRDAALAKEELLQKQKIRDHRAVEASLMRALNRMRVKTENERYL